MKKKQYLPSLLLFLILLLGFFFRVFRFSSLYPFAHDQDLYSWIIKDISIDHHLRFIGQETSVNGIYIGPFYYYLLLPFFLLFKMDPAGVIIPVALIGIANIFSLYWVIAQFWGKRTGLIASFLYAVSVNNILYDRWPVPTQPSVLWTIWFIFTLISLLRGEAKVLPLVGLLAGMIWHIHIALGPLLILFLFALPFYWKKISFKQIGLGILLFIMVTFPFWLFEFRHNFIQIKGLLGSFVDNQENPHGLYKFIGILNNASGNLSGNLFPQIKLVGFWSLVPIFFLFLFVWTKKITQIKEIAFFILWTAVIFASHFFSTRQISEYYFANLSLIFILLLSLALNFLLNLAKLKPHIIDLLILFLIVNTISFLKISRYPDGYYYKKQLVEFIQQDANLKKYPCISVNYITRIGNSVGYRYLFWWKNITLIKPDKGAPVYNIVMPAEISKGEITNYFGNMGVILPEIKEFKDKTVCENPANELEPLLGFTR